MPQYMRGYIYFFILGEMGIGLGSNTQDDTMRFTAREPPAGARQKEDRGGVLPCLEPFVQDLARVPMQSHKISDHPAFDLHACKSLASVLVPI